MARQVKGKIMDRLKGLDVFRGLKDAQISKIMKAGALVFHEEDRILFEKLQMGGAMYIVLYGAVEVIDQYRGKQKAIALLGPGETFGEMAVFTGRGRTASVRTTKDTLVLVLDEAVLEKLLRERVAPRFLANLVRILSERLRVTNAHYLRAKYKQAD